LAITTSDTATSFRTISWPAGFMGLSVRPSLLRPICRNMAPSPPSATGVTQRSFAAVELLDADHLGAEVAQHRAAEGPAM
jgi:hypothetical protein